MTLRKIDEIKLPTDLDSSQIMTHGEFIGNQPSLPTAPVNIFINSKMKLQTIQGIGGSFSEIGGKALLSLEESSREALSKDLFAQHLNYFRLPMGSSDFALSAYSLHEQDQDFELKAFSLEKDEKYIIPYVKMAKKYCPEMKLHISPWSPPAWMKESGKMEGGSSLIDKKEYYTAYALYFAKYIQAYEQLGFPVHRLNVQNEPDVDPIYPSCIMPPKQMAHFIQHFLHPLLQKENIPTEIFAGTFRSLNGAHASDFLTATPNIQEYIHGIGTQYSAMQPIYDVLSKKEYNHLKFMHTESNCFDGKNSWEQALTLYKSIVTYLTAGCDSFTYWNMILNETQKSSWGWEQNSMVLVDETTKKVTYNPDYYVMKLAASSILPQSQRISYISRNQMGIAVVNPDESVYFLCCNLNQEAKSGKVVVNDQEIPLSLEAMSITAFSVT